MTLGEKIVSRISIEGDHWIWQGRKNWKGYGMVNKTPRHATTAHRAAYEVFVGPVADGHDVHHRLDVCGRRDCVRPAHLLPLDHAEHTRLHQVRNTDKTHCSRGHEFTPENRQPKNGTYTCRACERARAATSHHRSRLIRQGRPFATVEVLRAA
jgi:hypothetical protein